jgi:hypothetical protein
MESKVAARKGEPFRQGGNGSTVFERKAQILGSERQVAVAGAGGWTWEAGAGGRKFSIYHFSLVIFHWPAEGLDSGSGAFGS